MASSQSFMGTLQGQKFFKGHPTFLSSLVMFSGSQASKFTRVACNENTQAGGSELRDSLSYVGTFRPAWATWVHEITSITKATITNVIKLQQTSVRYISLSDWRRGPLRLSAWPWEGQGPGKLSPACVLTQRFTTGKSGKGQLPACTSCSIMQP